MPDATTLMHRLWDLLNAHAFEDAAALLDPDVDWASLLEGGRLKGREAVVAYWNRMVEYIRPESVILGIEARPDGRLALRMHHVLRRPSGGLWTQETITHVYSFRDGLIAVMDSED